MASFSQQAVGWLAFCHFLLVLVLASQGIVSAAGAEAPVATSKCPFKATTAFISQTFSFAKKPTAPMLRLNAYDLASSSPLILTNNVNQLLASTTATSTSLPYRIQSDMSVDRRRQRRAAITGPRTGCMKLRATTVERDADVATTPVVPTEKKEKKKRTAEALEVVVLGLSHHNAKVEVREKLAIPEDNWNEAATALCEYNSISEAAVLSTCNRFELYLAGQNQYELIKDAINYLEERAGGSLDQATLRRSLFMLSGEDAIWHLLKVSAGLDSLIVGEGQILAQVKRAYEHGIEPDVPDSGKAAGQSGKVVSRMLNTAVSAGKRVRSETGISKGAVSISSAAAEFTEMKVKDDCAIQNGLEGANICIIGAGKMARLLLVHLQTQGVKTVTIVNRSPDRVLELRTEFPDMTLNLELMDQMWNVLQKSDVVFPSTAATTTIIDPEPLKECLKGRTSRPGGIQFIDISVPRNVHPDCAAIPGVFSYNVDDLKAVVERNTAKRRREMLEAENILREELSKYRLWQQSLGAIPTIAKLQEKAELMRLEELSKATKKLTNLSAKDMDAVDRLSKGIIAKLLHGPMTHLRQQNEGDATRAAIQQVQQAFQLE